MKTNAIIRIVIWSLVVVLLLGILASGLYRPARRVSDHTPVETCVPVPMDQIPAATEPGSVPGTEATVTATTVNVRSEPASGSSAAGMLKKDDVVIVTQQQKINGENWAYIVTPVSGWIKAEYLALETAAPAVSDGDLSLDPRQIDEIDIEWVAGSIVIESADVDSIRISEAASGQSVHPMVWKQNNRKLSIRFSENTTFDFGIHLTDEATKHLTVLVPRGWECDSLEIDAASATVDVKNLTVRELDFDGASGTCNFVNCTVEELDLDNASGDVYFTGKLNAMDCDAASASVYTIFDNVPSRIDMDSVSGDLDITLPADAGFSVSMNAMSSDFHTDFGYSQKKDGSYFRGDGECRITLDAMSGDLYIREYREADAKAVIPTDPTASETHHHTDACTTDPDSCPDNATHHTDAHHN